MVESFCKSKLMNARFLCKGKEDFAFSTLRETTITLHPLSIKELTIAFPIPPCPPITNATLSRKRFGIVICGMTGCISLRLVSLIYQRNKFLTLLAILIIIDSLNLFLNNSKGNLYYLNQESSYNIPIRYKIKCQANYFRYGILAKNKLRNLIKESNLKYFSIITLPLGILGVFYTKFKLLKK